MKILYLSVHSILEYDEVKLLHELGHEIFSPGAYVEPANPGDHSLRPDIPGLVYDPDLVEEWKVHENIHPEVNGKEYLYKSPHIIDKFDIIIDMHFPNFILANWEAIKRKRVIWRTIGQSVASTEAKMKRCKDQGMEVVRYSPKEVHIPGFIGMDALIRFYKDPAEYGNWNGNTERIITFAQHMRQRDAACNFSFFEEITRPFPRHLFGPGNEGLAWSTGKVSHEQQKVELQNNRAYFYTGTHPASYTLNFMEAWMCFPEDTLVSSDTEIEDVLSKEYEGDLLTITTEDNISVSCTPTHPFLTQRGFVQAQELGILDSIYQYQETSCNEQVDKRRIRDLVEEFQKTNKGATGTSSSQKLLGNYNEVQNTGTKTTEFDHFQSSSVFYDTMRDLVLGRNSRWRGNFVLQNKQEKQKNSSNSPDYKHRSCSDKLVDREAFHNKPRSVEQIFTKTKEKFRILVEGVEDINFTGSISSLSLDQKRAMWNFDWFHQEQIDSKIQSTLLSIRNRLLSQDKSIKSKRIKSITRKPFRGTVYNLSTSDGVYRAEGFIVHNTGIPIVAIGKEKGNADWCRNHDLYEVSDLIENGVTGFVSDSSAQLQDTIKGLLAHPDVAKKIGEQGRAEAIRHFGKDMIKEAWRSYLG